MKCAQVWNNKINSEASWAKNEGQALKYDAKFIKSANWHFTFIMIYEFRGS